MLIHRHLRTDPGYFSHYRDTLKILILRSFQSKPWSWGIMGSCQKVLMKDTVKWYIPGGKKVALVWCGDMVLGFILLMCVSCRKNVEWQIFRQENLQLGCVTQCQRMHSGRYKETESRIKWNINSQIRCDKTGNMEFYWNQFNISKKVSGWYLVGMIF